MNGGDAAPLSRTCFRLGSWQVEADLGRLRQGEKEIYLRPQLMQALLLLAEHRGRCVPVERLVERVWARRLVSPSVVARCISDLRHALGDNARFPHLIETLPKRGYRIASCVLPVTGEAPSPPEATSILPQAQTAEEAGGPVGWRNVFVGRNAELALLGRRLDQAVRGSGTMVLVSGDPGSGKTVLLKEFLWRATAAHQALLVASGRGSAHAGFGEPLGLFRELLALLTGDVQSRTAAGDLEPEQADRLWRAAPEVIRLVLEFAPSLIGGLLPGGGLLERARAVGSDRPTCERLAEVARQRTALPALEGQRQDQISGQIAEVLAKVSSQAPLALLFDDLQWCDSASCAALFQLARACARQRLLLVAAFRPEEAGEGGHRKGSFGDLAPELKTRGGIATINLDLAGGRSFVDAFLDAEPNRFDERFRARFTQSTGGSPLFTAELLNGMRETRTIWRDADGSWNVQAELDWSRIPGRLEPVIAQRMGRLPQRLRQLINVAAVEGEEFTAETVAAVLGRDMVHVVGDLGEWLERRFHLVVPVDVRRLGPSRRSTYRFRHTLFQSWLYAQLDAAERALLHERIGCVMERLYPEHGGGLAALLARHFAAADLPVQAIRYYRQAARHATRFAADQEALQFLRAGLRLVHRLPQGKARDQAELELQLAQGLTLVALRGYASSEVSDCLCQIRELCHRNGEKAHWFGMLWQCNMLAGLGAEYERALQAAEEMLLLAQELADADAVKLAHLARGWIGLMMGRLSKALLDLDRAAVMTGTPHELVAACGLEPRATALAWSSWIHYFQGNPSTARECSARAIALARASDNPLTLAFCLGVGGALLQSLLGDPEQSLCFSQEVEAVARQHGLAFYSAGGQLYRGYAHFLQGLYGRSLEEIEAGLAAWKMTGTRAYQPFFLSVAGLAHYHLDHASEALRSAEAAIEQVERTGERMFESEIRRHYALLLQDAGDSKRARSELCRAIKVARQQGASVFLQRAITALDALGPMRVGNRKAISSKSIKQPQG